MTALVESAGLQATLQGGPRLGFRHRGMPWAGAADPVSLALANHLVSNAHDDVAIEVTYGGFSLTFETPAAIALTGASCPATLSGRSVPFHQTLYCDTGAELVLAPPERGVRTYIAIAGGGWSAQEILGSTSTYLPAALGGFEGRALRNGDQLSWTGPSQWPNRRETPSGLQQVIQSSWALRATESAETHLLSKADRERLFEAQMTVSRLSDRMGIRLEGVELRPEGSDRLPSAAVFPGTVQCPADGDPILLQADSQTTGGYPRIAHIARCDRHLLGQIRPGDSVRLLYRTPEQAVEADAGKQALISSWLGAFRLF